MKRNTNLFELLRQEIINAVDISEEDRNTMLSNVRMLQRQMINILITGATGSGKSSTINAMFNTEVATVGVGVDPETMEIEKYELENMVLWDSPGFGDSPEADERHAQNIIKKLNEIDENGNAVIDLVLVILDGSTRDMGTTYELIEDVIIPNLGENKESRILVAINQADLAMKGRNWDEENNCPNQTLINFLNRKALSVKTRIFDATGVTVEPIYYSAGCKEEGCPQRRPYNLSKLLYYIVRSIPSEKRMIFAADNLNTDVTMWQDDDQIINYREETKRSIFSSIVEGVADGVEIGKNVGSLFGVAGETIGSIVGGIVGGVVGFFKALFW